MNGTVRVVFRTLAILLGAASLLLGFAGCADDADESGRIDREAAAVERLLEVEGLAEELAQRARRLSVEALDEVDSCAAVKDYGCVEKAATASEEASKFVLTEAGVLFGVHREINRYSDAAIRQATKGS